MLKKRVGEVASDSYFQEIDFDDKCGAGTHQILPNSPEGRGTASPAREMIANGVPLPSKRGLGAHQHVHNNTR